MPITFPLSFRTGPPELPGLAGACVWKIGVPASFFFFAVSGPSVTVGVSVDSLDRPARKVEAMGYPATCRESPSATSSFVPIGRVGNWVSPSILSTATSLPG